MTFCSQRYCYLLAAGLMLIAAAPTPAAITAVALSPRLPTTRDTVSIQVIGTLACPGLAFSSPQVIDGEIVVAATSGGYGSPCLTQSRTLSVGTLTQGSHHVRVLVDGQTAFETDMRVDAIEEGAYLLDLRFLLQAAFTSSRGHTRLPGAGVNVSDQAAFFWFFDPTAPDVVVKVLDGRGFNRHFWVFVTSLSDVPFDLSVTDTRSPQCDTAAGCPVRVYHNTSTKGSIFDFAAF